MLRQLPPNCLLKNPAGTYSFVGRVDAGLGYCQKDGTPATAKQLRIAATHGPRLAGLSTRTFPTPDAAREAAAALGLTVTE